MAQTLRQSFNSASASGSVFADAVARGDHDLVKKLIEMGADPNAMDGMPVPQPAAASVVETPAITETAPIPEMKKRKVDLPKSEAAAK